MLRCTVLIILFGAVAGCAQVAPPHNIPVRQDFVNAGLKPGDTVEVTLTDGSELRFELVAIHFNQIEGPDGNIELRDIAKITLRSWSEPGHPCGANEPVGCSIPEVVLLLSEEYASQAAKFHSACVTHDYCYRHGFLTYDETREQCDSAFLDDMKEACGGFKGLDLLELKEYSTCKLAADQTFNAVRLKGEPYFRTTNGTFCEYRFGQDEKP